jgi:hypothetical protein
MNNNILGEDMEGNGCGLIEVPLQHSPVVKEENHE